MTYPGAPYLMDFPFIVFALSLVGLWSSAKLGVYLQSRRALKEMEREDVGIILGATLTLLGLIIGFTFSMAVSRYDQRKLYEEDEANAIGTEYVRAGILPQADAARVRTMLRAYVDQRVLFYSTRDRQRLAGIKAATSRLQNDLWSIMEPVAAAQPTQTVALVVSGMNDVLNSEGYTQASWWNRIPVAAWMLMAAIAICGNVLVGYNGHHTAPKVMQFFVLPLLISIAFLLIADLDSPNGGLIRVAPQNLLSLAASLGTP
jgi:hypothetical protein